MAIGRVMHENVVLFPDFDDIFRETKRDEFWEMQLFLQIPNLTKTDILEYFEYIALGYSIGGVECDCLYIPMSYLDSKDEVIENDSNPTYISEYINIVGQLFLGDYIDFGSYCDNDDRDTIDYPSNLSYYKEDKYQAWIHFKDNFFYTDAYYRDIIDLREKYPNMSDDEYRNADWDTPQYWDRDRFWVARTPKGNEYFEKVLAPRFYNKYKDLEVEIDSKGNIIRWIGEINR
ncbi:hypothetical protein NHP164001_20630 [Helicobacter trogontum]|uniref:Uncharacterized protein n=1 Tax=Helicobacter trogontum TaxID=50960 RepID=A0ABQ0D733_9HELI